MLLRPVHAPLPYIGRRAIYANNYAPTYKPFLRRSAGVIKIRPSLCVYSFNCTKNEIIVLEMIKRTKIKYLNYNRLKVPRLILFRSILFDYTSYASSLRMTMNMLLHFKVKQSYLRQACTETTNDVVITIIPIDHTVIIIITMYIRTWKRLAPVQGVISGTIQCRRNYISYTTKLCMSLLPLYIEQLY